MYEKNYSCVYDSLFNFNPLKQFNNTFPELISEQSFLAVWEFFKAWLSKDSLQQEIIQFDFLQSYPSTQFIDNLRST